MISTAILTLALIWSQSGSPAAAESSGPTAGLAVGTEGRIAGRVTVPVTKVKKRKLRGSAYRSRLSGGGARTTASRAPTSPLSNVVISAHPRSLPVSPEPVSSPRVNQENVSFAPRVLPVTVGSVVEFVNRDKVYHNVFSLTPGASFDIGRKRTGDVHAEKIDALGPIELFCDIHPQMNATILSLDTPFFTMADSIGVYALGGLPEGEYEIRVFHPDFATQSAVVHLQTGGESRLDFALNP